MSARKPRASDVARWVATLAAPDASLYDRVARREQRQARVVARTNLASYGLDAQGNAKPATVAQHTCRQCGDEFIRPARGDGFCSDSCMRQHDVEISAVDS